MWGIRNKVLVRFKAHASVSLITVSPELSVEKLKYIHLNPIQRGLVSRREDWPWSSYRHYALGESGTVQIESPVAAWKRRQIGKQNTLTLPEN